MRFLLVLILAFLPFWAHAEAIIRDAEIEGVIKEIAKPIFKVAGLNPESVNVYIYQSEEPNAFVPEGKNIFISTPLLAYSDNPETVVGVLAHEVGHITGGHIIARKSEIENFRKRALLSSAIGAIAGLATRSPEVFIGASSIGTDNSLNQLMNYTRNQEAAADQSALKYLHQLGVGNHGLIEFLDTLKAEERINTDTALQYLRTHPISQERINAIKSYNAKTKETSGGFDAALQEKFRRIVAKVRAYADSPNSTIRHYEHDTSVAGKYAVAIANMRIPHHAKALDGINQLIALEPNNPYFREIKGQMLLEMRKTSDAVEEFRKSYQLLPRNALIKYQYAAILNLTKKENSKAIALLEEAVTAEPDFPTYWHQLGIAYGLNRDQLNSNLALAYEAILKNDGKTANRMLAIAEKDAVNSKSKRTLLRYKDLKQAVLNIEGVSSDN
jgi:predicted Zn-dependent protease